jgi:cystathionine beta-lyase/cystathionine gamma-synthase
MLEQRIALLEGAEACRATATGMAAMTAALLCQLSAGDHVVAAKAAFGSCRWLVDTLLPKFLSCVSSTPYSANVLANQNTCKSIIVSQSLHENT